ncbi:AMMECR1 domain-containing protein [Geothermobacter hydrogeniphilus]|uniref:AMMECR1 domain-containing protein n=1 Tax=Geothermobacter hydrogeniphilus TaxID=1969733 RepID=A0A1X0Y1Y6_9BACT|nr:AMMECR1 domain-containing protein [Geothermobacter hydrogeniphilus]
MCSSGGDRVEKKLTAKQCRTLLEIARQAIEHAVQEQPFEPEPREEKALNMRNGCFVSIHQKGELRGCIGNFQAELPLFREVARMAISSATQDPRFYPVQQDELADLKLEISVLSPLQKIEDISEIQVGKHGIYLEKSFHRGVLLPQVAPEHGWDRDEFLKQTCIKAGLPTNAWQGDDADIYIFTAQIFSEK